MGAPLHVSSTSRNAPIERRRRFARCVCDGMRAELDRHLHEGSDNGLSGSYDDGTVGQAPEHGAEGLPARSGRYDNGFKDGGGFAP